MMRVSPILATAILGGAFVAACYSDDFRRYCRKAINGIGGEVNGRINEIIREFNSKQSTDKGNNDGNGNERGDNLPAPRC